MLALTPHIEHGNIPPTRSPPPMPYEMVFGRHSGAPGATPSHRARRHRGRVAPPEVNGCVRDLQAHSLDSTLYRPRPWRVRRPREKTRRRRSWRTDHPARSTVSRTASLSYGSRITRPASPMADRCETIMKSATSRPTASWSGLDRDATRRAGRSPRRRERRRGRRWSRAADRSAPAR